MRGQHPNELCMECQLCPRPPPLGMERKTAPKLYAPRPSSALDGMGFRAKVPNSPRGHNDRDQYNWQEYAD